jgi:glycosyltransferase involved in cell wall biosynthesis
LTTTASPGSSPTSSSAGSEAVLSAILPNFNHAQHLSRALDALLAQDRPPDEIIVVDDASTDDSLAVLERYAASSSTIKVLANKENQGALASLQRGLDAACGRYVYFGAADDWVLPGFLSLGVSMLEASPGRGLFCGEVQLVDGDTGAPLGIRPVVRPRFRAGEVDERNARSLLARADHWIHTGSTIFRRDLVLRNGGFDARLGSFADSYLSRKVALASGFCYAPEVVAVWNIFSGGLSRAAALDLRRARQFLVDFPRIISADPKFPEWYADLYKKRWRFATSRLALEARPVDAELLRAMGGPERIDQVVLATLSPYLSRSPVRLAALAWLWFRLRPYRLRDLVATALSRRFDRLFKVRPRAGGPAGWKS